MIFHSLTLGIATNFMRTTFSGMLQEGEIGVRKEKLEKYR
jgi:hypothetical protein